MRSTKSTRRTPKFWLFFLLLIAVFGSVVAFWHSRVGQAISPKHGKQQRSLPNEILVRFSSETKALEFDNQSLKVDEAVSVQLARFAGSDLVPGLRVARLNEGTTDAAIEALNKRPDVVYAEPNYTRQAFATPNDPNFPQMWGLNNSGAFGGTAGADIRAVTAWDTTTGSRNVAVGIVDEGIDINHPDLAANIWQNPGEIANNGIDDDNNGYVDDTNGWDFFHNDKTVYDGAPGDNVTDAHGTHVAGTVGASGNNSLGVTGVNWQVSLVSLKVLGRNGEAPPTGNVVSLVTAFSYAMNLRETWQTSGGARGANLRVLNNSYGGYGFSQAELDAIRALNESGILFVCAAGNDGSSNDRIPVYPATYFAPNLISVAATGRSDLPANFTNLGRATVNLAAPGVEILSTAPNGQ